VKPSLALPFLTLFVASCGRPETKVRAMSGLVGTWMNDWVAPDGGQAETKETIAPDGRWTGHCTYTYSNAVATTEDQSVAEIRNGCLILTMTNGSDRRDAPLP